LGSKSWSCAYHVSFGVAAILSVIVATLSGKDISLLGLNSSQLVLLLSLAAAVLTTIGGFGGFERKWRTNRETRAALQILAIDSSDGNFSTADFRRRLRRIIVAHESGIMASNSLAANVLGGDGPNAAQPHDQQPGGDMPQNADRQGGGAPVAR
jgi:hypothetical protein